MSNKEFVLQVIKYLILGLLAYSVGDTGKELATAYNKKVDAEIQVANPGPWYPPRSQRPPQ